VTKKPAKTTTARAAITIEPCEDILFFHRPPPAEGADLILYAEDQIAHLLFSEETLDDVLYRFMETDNGMLIAIARKKKLEQKPLPPNKHSLRLPSAVVLWLRARGGIASDAKALLYLPEGDHAWLLCADALQIHYVYRVQLGDEREGELLAAIDSLAERSVSRTVWFYGTLSDTVRAELAARSITYAPLALSPAPATDRAVFAAWDFRLPSEQSGQELYLWKRRVMKSILYAGAGIACVWALLFGGNQLLYRAEDRATQRWGALRSSLKEITYLQKETRGLIAEIALCRTLADRRTNRAGVLQTAAQSRPADVILELLRIGERKKRFVKGASPIVAEETLLIEGVADDPRDITAWMDTLMKSGTFTSVNLLSMERKGASYRYQIECGLPERSGQKRR
jgi:Tfp pilus assembly protein PilN